MIIALFPNVNKPQACHFAIGIAEFLKAKGITVIADDSESADLDCEPLSSYDHDKIDFAISLGGDGTILRLIHRYPDLKAPVVGVNLGTLGILADIPVSAIYTSLEEILTGSYTVQDRLMLSGDGGDGRKCIAVNDIVIHRAKNPCIIDLAIHVDGIYLNTFSADGIIIATTTGSTAYSLASGGPILTPELEALVITPISPHTISNRPIVLMPKSEIKIQYISQHQPVEVIYDGLCNFTMKKGEVFNIRKAEKRFRLVSLNSHDYFTTLRGKLGWAGTLKI